MSKILWTISYIDVDCLDDVDDVSDDDGDDDGDDDCRYGLDWCISDAFDKW